jgi:hypothetical protein
MIRPSVLIATVAAVAAGGLTIAAASGSSPETPAETVQRVAQGLAEGDVTACDAMTPRVQAALVADAPAGTDCAGLVRRLGRQGWFVDAMEGATTETTTQDARRAVVRLELADASVSWLRLVPSDDGWLVDGGPWDVRVS